MSEETYEPDVLDSDYSEPSSYTTDALDVPDALDAPSRPGLTGVARPTWHRAAGKELWDMYMGVAHLGETGVLAMSNLLPEGEAGGLLRAAQDLGVERGKEDWEALKKAPMAAVRSLGETFLSLVPGSDYSFYDKIKYQPIQTVTDLMTPFSAVSGIAKSGGKAAAIAGKTDLAKTLIGAGETLAPTNLAKAGARSLRNAPVVGTVLKNADYALDAQRWYRREQALGRQFAEEQMIGLERHFADVPPHERDAVIDLVEGTYGPGARGVKRELGTGQPTEAEPLKPLISNATRAAIEQYRLNREVGMMKEAAILSSGDPALYDHILKRFDFGRFKPLAQKTSYELGVEITAPQAKRLWEEGLIGTHELPPIYYPHIKDLTKAEHADGFVKSLEPYWHSSLKVRTGSPEFDRDFLRANATYERSKAKYLANYNATMSVVNTQGVPLHGLRTERELVDALAELKKVHGVEYVYFAPELFKHNFNAQAKAQGAILNALAESTPQSLDQALQKSLKAAAGEFGEDYHAGALKIIEDMKARPEGPEIVWSQGNRALPPGPPRDMNVYGTPGGPPPGRAHLYAIPKASAKRLLEEMGGIPDGLRAFGLANDIWRAMVLPLNLGWNTMNALGNAYLSVLSGSFNPKFRLKVKDYLLPDMQTAGITGESKLIEAMSKADRAKITTMGLPVGQWYNKIADTLPAAAVAWVVEKGYKLNEIVDTFARESVAAGRLKSQAITELRLEGKSGLLIDPKVIEQRAIEIASDPIRAQKTVDFVNDFMGNYFDLTPWQRKYLRNFAFPFWSWWKSMAKLSYTLPVTYPGRTQALQMLAAAQAEAEDDPLMPPEIRERVLLNKLPSGRTLAASSRTMVPMLQSIEGLPSASPLLGATIMALTGETPIGQPITPEGVENVRGRNMLYEEGRLPTDAGRAENAMMNTYSALRETIRGLPQVRLVESLIKGETARPGDPIFGSKRETIATPYSSTQTGWEAFASQTGIQFKEFNVDLAKYRYGKRLAQAYIQGAKRDALRKKREQDAIKDALDEAQDVLDRIK